MNIIIRNPLISYSGTLHSSTVGQRTEKSL